MTPGAFDRRPYHGDAPGIAEVDGVDSRILSSLAVGAMLFAASCTDREQSPEPGTAEAPRKFAELHPAAPDVPSGTAETISAKSPLADRGYVDLVRRKDELVAVLHRKLAFLDANGGADVAATEWAALDELCPSVAASFGVLLDAAPDHETRDGPRSEADALFQQTAASARRRAFALRESNAVMNQSDLVRTVDFALCRTLFAHASTFPHESSERAAHFEAALNQYEEFDLDYCETLLNYCAYIDMGRCLAELGRRDDAIASIDMTIHLDEGEWPTDADGAKKLPSDVAEIVCRAVLEKISLLEEAKRAAEVVEVGHDYVRNVADPFGATCGARLADKIAAAMRAKGEIAAAAEIEQMRAQAERRIPVPGGR